MPNALTIPLTEMASFGELPFVERGQVRLWLDILGRFEAAEDKRAAVIEIRNEFGGQVKVSQGTLYRKLKSYQSHGWRGLVNRARCRRRATGLPEAFVDFWQVLCQENQRKTAPAYRSLFSDHLLVGKAIPGYGTWPQIWRAEHEGWSVPPVCPYRAYDNVPDGWTYRNLLRRAPDVYQLTAARIGTGAASQFLPDVPTTRVGLSIGEYFVIDDMFHDVRVNFVGNRAAQIPLELGALDLFTGHYCVWGIKPVREREDGTREHLKEDYVRFLLAHLLCRMGINPDGCTIMGEHGTANVDGDLLGSINRWASGRVRFEAGGIQGAPIAKGLFDGRPRGNFRFKAALESHHNLKHNELALLSGQKGMDRDHAPEDQYGRDQVNNALTKAIVALEDTRPDLIDLLRRPYMPFHQFIEMLGILYDRVADRKHHEIEGFEEAGLVVQEFRLADGLPWMPLAELRNYDDQQRAAIEAVIRRPGMVKLRVMSPLEAWRAHERQLVRLPDCAVPDILGPRLGDVVKVADDKTISVRDREVPGKSYVYVGLAIAPNGREIDLARRDEFLVHVSPFDTSEAYVSTVEGEFIGKSPCLHRACRNTAGIEKNLGMLRHVISLETKRLAPLADKRLREQYEAAEQNAVALTGRNPVHDAQAQQELEAEAASARVDDSDLIAAGCREEQAESPIGMAEIADLLRM
jgi:hypothetical protein